MNGSQGWMRPASAERHTFICAWCSVLLRSSPDPNCAVVNYGICPQCLESQLRVLASVGSVPSANGRKPGPRRRGRGPAGCVEDFADS
jgi:hypothetical protein